MGTYIAPDTQEWSGIPGQRILVRNDNELILVDTPWGVEATEELLDWVKRELKLPVKRAIITHFHADSMGGTSVLDSRGIPFFSSALTRTLEKDEGVPLPTALNGLSIG